MTFHLAARVTNWGIVPDGWQGISGRVAIRSVEDGVSVRAEVFTGVVFSAVSAGAFHVSRGGRLCNETPASR